MNLERGQRSRLADAVNAVAVVFTGNQPRVHGAAVIEPRRLLIASVQASPLGFTCAGRATGQATTKKGN